MFLFILIWLVVFGFLRFFVVCVLFVDLGFGVFVCESVEDVVVVLVIFLLLVCLGMVFFCVFLIKIVGLVLGFLDILDCVVFFVVFFFSMDWEMWKCFDGII